MLKLLDAIDMYSYTSAELEHMCIEPGCTSSIRKLGSPIIISTKQQHIVSHTLLGKINYI